MVSSFWFGTTGANHSDEWMADCGFLEDERPSAREAAGAIPSLVHMHPEERYGVSRMPVVKLAGSGEARGSRKWYERVTCAQHPLNTRPAQ